MSDRISWRDMEIMERVLHQGEKQVCWAISLTRQLAALLKLRGLLNINATLSIQYLINKVGSSLFGAQNPRLWNGSIHSLEIAVPFLVRGGPVLEHVVPLRRFDLQSRTPENHVLGEQRHRAVRIVVHRRDEYADEAAFEADLLRCLHKSPVAASIRIFPSFESIIGNRIYRPLPGELDEPTTRHCMLLVKSSLDASGTPYWEFQDSRGESRGRDGYVRLRKGAGLLTEFVEMFLLEEEPGKKGKKRKAESVDASHRKRANKVYKRLSLGPERQSQSKKLSQGRSGSSSTSTIRKAVRPISPKSPLPSASAFENMGESDDDNIAELDASYMQTNGYLESEVGGKLGKGGETKGEILQNLAEFQLSCVMFNAVLENACSEMGAGMSAMDSSSRNAGEMLDCLTLTYNMTLRASITTAPIETISGASALEAS